MEILVTGSNGFVGKNLVWNLKAIRDGKNRTREGLEITQVYGYDLGAGVDELEYACSRADFVFHLAGVNRPAEGSAPAESSALAQNSAPAENNAFMEGNVGFLSTLLETLKKYGNNCPVMFSSSTQASLAGRFAGSQYGRSKLAGEGLMFAYAREAGAKALVYRFPNVFGKWCRPNYNSAVATFCHAIANGLAYTVNDPGTELELLYIDDLIEGMLDALEGKERRCEYHGAQAVPCAGGRFCFVSVVHHATLGEITGLLHTFHSMQDTFFMADMPAGSFTKKLYSTYLSYLPQSAASYCLHPNTDSRGSFIELLKTKSCGQVSVNVVKPGAVRGQHWHNSKCEIFFVVNGHGRIRQRRVGTDPGTGKPYPVLEFEVSGERPAAVRMLPGYTHNVANLSQTEDLILVIWANEPFDGKRPDTFYEPV